LTSTRFGAPRRGEQPLNGAKKPRRQQEWPADGIVAARFFVETSARLFLAAVTHIYITFL
jgi:hypothetical protein